MSRANVRGLGISGPTSPLHNGQSVPSNSPYSPVPTVSGSATRLDVLDHGLAYDPSESYEDVVGFSMDDGTTPAPTFVGLSNVHLSREDRQEGYDTTLLELHPRGENRGSLVENLDSPPHSPPLSPSPSGDPFASPPSPLFSGGGSSMRSVGTGSPRPKSQEPMFSISDSTRFAAMGYENRARDAARASKTASKRVSHTPAGLSEKPGQEERVQKWRKVRTLAIIAIVVVIIALAVGLGAGLGTKKSNSNKAASATSSASSSSSISPASELTRMQNAQTVAPQQQRGTSAPSGGPGKDAHTNRVDVIDTKGGRILCVADVRGAISTLNILAAEHSAVAIIHSGDFGFYEQSSLPSISDRTLRHLVQYSSLIPPPFRSLLLNPSTTPQQMRDLLVNPPKGTSPSESFFGLSEFPKLLTGELKLNVPVYTVWGACEDVAILEKIRLAAPSLITVPSDPSKPPTPPAQQLPTTTSGYSIPNLTVLDEATTRVLLIGGVRLRLFGLGGAVVSHKLFDTGTGSATIAGGGGTMWTTVLQVGELVDTAQKVYDPTETRLLVSHASPGREGLLTQLCLVLKADLTLSAGLHFRYGVSYNEFSVQHDPEAFKGKLEYAKKGFNDVWDTVKNQVDGVIDENQRRLLENALAVANRVPAAAPVGGGPAVEETAWKNCWNWNLPDAAFGSLVLDIRDGRVGSEMKSQGFNFAYRQNNARPTPSASASAPRPAVTPAAVTPAPATASTTPSVSNTN
ncbi:hypothetical protein P7C70_g6612, partial [Phenoliferia sp. Uapishka_3]